MSDRAANATKESPGAGNVMRQVEEALRGLRFGHVTVIVQDGAVAQIERTERKRLDPTGKLK
jgi:hypothetical protein